MGACTGYITTKDKAEAIKIATALVEKHLVACANIIDGIGSIYRWEGKVEQSQETLLLVKTQSKQKKKILTVVKALHSYSCPCAVFYDIADGSPEYLKWLLANSEDPT